MCGIVGFSGRGDAELLGRMNDALAHRGPDDAGVLHLPNVGVGLGHRRLSIIDLSPRGHQPMWDATRSVVITYNGELYNYRELREELVRDGFRFQSDSDTEVLLNLYRRDGDGMLGRLNGIFAFAIYDTEKRGLLLARDGFGVKPLYVAETRDRVLFASELKALLQDPELDRTIDPEAVRAHLLYLWCPAPHTMLRSVRKLEPGRALWIENGKVVRNLRHYDVPVRDEHEPFTEARAKAEVETALRRAVERQLVADVQVGAFLSGGLDSSSVVAMARQALPGERIPCFTIGFEGGVAGVEGITEDLPYARRVAEHLDVDLHEIHVGPEMVDELETMLFHLDEPQADPAPINALFIARLAREHGIKVLLSGAGGDDVFTGYRRHYALLQERTWAWLPRPARRALAAGASALPPRDALRRRLRKAFEYADLDGDARLASYFQWIPPSRVDALLAPALRGALGPDGPEAPLLRALERVPDGAHPLDRMLYLETQFFLADHNLNYTDKTSMAAGVEVRVPLLDPDLVDLAMRLPMHLRQRGREGKWILKEVMRGHLPADVIDRPKTGFGAPLRQWLRGPLRPVVDDVLSPASLGRRGLFDPDGVAALVAADREERVDAAYTIFSLVCIELWCRMFLDGRTPAAPAAASNPLTP